MEEKATEEIDGTLQRVTSHIVKAGQDSQDELTAMKVEPAQHFDALVGAVQSAMKQIGDTTVPKARETLLSAWKHAERKAEMIKNHTEDELTMAVPEVQTMEQTFESNAKKLMDGINEQMFKSLSTSQAQLNSYMEELNQLVGDVQTKAESA